MFGLVLLLVGIAMCVKAHRMSDALGRAQFERTNEYGTQTFADYDELKSVEKREGRGRGSAFLLMFFGFVLIVIGMGIMAGLNR